MEIKNVSEEADAEADVKKVLEEKKVVDNTPQDDAGGTKEEKIVESEKEKTFEAIDSANAAADRLEEANKAAAKNLDRQEAIKAQEILGGKAEAGSKEKTAEEREIASTKEFLKGTGYEDDLFPAKEKSKSL